MQVHGAQGSAWFDVGRTSCYGGSTVIEPLPLPGLMPPYFPSLIAVLCWGGMFPVADAAMDHVDAAHITSIRYGVATLIFLALLAAVEGRSAVRYDGRFRRAWLFGTLGFAGFNLLSY